MNEDIENIDVLNDSPERSEENSIEPPPDVLQNISFEQFLRHWNSTSQPETGQTALGISGTGTFATIPPHTYTGQSTPTTSYPFSMRSNPILNEQERDVVMKRYSEAHTFPDGHSEVIHTELCTKSLYRVLGLLDEKFFLSRRHFLNMLDNPVRMGMDTYQKFLVIRVTLKEFIEIKEGKTTILKKMVPDWVMSDISRGITVKALLFIEPKRPLYFTYEHEEIVTKLAPYIQNRDNSSKINIINGRLSGIIDINNIVKTEIQRDGTYCKNINTIALKTKKSVSAISHLGKIKPIFLLELNRFRFINYSNKIESYIFMTKFNVYETVDSDNITVYKLFLEKHMSDFGFKNMGTVWV
jgi:hypothetical protein